MIRFCDLLNIHRDSPFKGSLPDILGDGFLLKENAVYRRVRELALNLGVQLTEATPDYLLMPFNQLDKIVASKQVPYVPHARLMSDIESQRPETFDLEQMPVAESYHMHECAHVIAAHFTHNIEVASRQDQILISIFCESFANTVDAISWTDAHSEIHQTYLKLNCYMSPTEAFLEQMKVIREELGENFLFQVVFDSYIFANFLHDEAPGYRIEEMVRAVRPDASKKLLQNCFNLSEIGQVLDPLFRVRTTENYFRLKGFEGEIYDLLAFDFEKRLTRSDFQAALKALTLAMSST